jgi:hypothetical protein
MPSFGAISELPISALPVVVSGGATSQPYGLAVETDTALAVPTTQSRAYGLAQETDTALAPSGIQSRAYGLASEADTAFAPGGSQSRPYGLASEADTAFALPAGGATSQPYGLAVEADTAFAPPATQARAYGLATETDSAFAASAIQSRAYGLASETDTSFALPVGGNVSQPYGLAIETDTAFALPSSLPPSSGGGEYLRDKLIRQFEDDQRRIEALRKLPSIEPIERIAIKKVARKLAKSPEPFTFDDVEAEINASLRETDAKGQESHLDWLLYFLRVEAYTLDRVAQEAEELEIVVAMMMARKQWQL